MPRPVAPSRNALALAVLALASAGAAAQQVTIYGVIDVAVERISNTTAAGVTNWRMPSTTGSVPSRWGLRGSEDLGNGLKAVFTLESGFAPGTGALGQAGRSFGRQAFVGLSGPWGTVALGRQYTMTFWSLLDADVIGPMVFAIGSLDPYIPNARVDNAISYRGTFSGLTVGATYSLGRDAANPTPNNPAGTNCPGTVGGDTKSCRAWSALLKYDQPTWGVALAGDTLRGGAGSWPAAGLTSSSLTDTRITLDGYVRVAGIKLGGGVIRRDNEGSATTPRSDLSFFGASWPVTPALTVDAQVARLKYKGSPNSADLLVLRGNYALSKRTSLYAALGHIANDGTLAVSVSGGAPGSAPPAGESQHGLVAGIRHAF
jgi:predicted porin